MRDYDTIILTLKIGDPHFFNQKFLKTTKNIFV